MTTRSLTTKVAAPKKAPAKKTASNKAAPLMVVSDSLAFWTINGQQLASLHDLALAFGKMERRVFNYHADAAYQDFAKWVDHTLKDKACAAALKKALTAKDAKVIVAEHLKKYGV